MGDIAALRGTWNIVPTPFLPSGELDLSSIPGLVRFVRDTGVDGMTILGVLGEAGRLGAVERSAGSGGALPASWGGVPACGRGSRGSPHPFVAVASGAAAGAGA